ncbi:MAG: contractile injection system protein, VgrG/Pvc8 family [Blastomonas sp.]
MADFHADRVELRIDNDIYTGWTEVSIRRGLDSLFGEFDITLASRARTGDAPWPLRAGARCSLGIDGEILIEGHIDRLRGSVNAGERTVNVSGRDLTADLADCSAIHKPGSWRNVSLAKIISELVAPFGIIVSIEADTGPNIRKFALQQGESVWSAIERLLRFRALIGWTRGDGRLVITTPGKGAVVASLIEGANLLSVTGSHDVTERFATYLVKGQASGSDERNGAAVAQLSASASDPAIRRYRPLLVVAEEQADRASLQKRADWEANVRAARSQPAEAIVQGWRDPSGALWKADSRVKLIAPSAYIDSEMLVVGVTLERGFSGTIAILQLERPEAWSQLPVPESADASALGAA